MGGYEDPDGQKQVTILQEGKMSLQSSDSFCEADQVCFAGSNSASVCHGDSGGPLVCQDDKWVLHGIVSNGHPSCMGVGAYSRPFLALDWISKCKSGSNELWKQEEWQNTWKDFDGGEYSKCSGGGNPTPTPVSPSPGPSPTPSSCADLDANCGQFANDGACTKAPEWMAEHCKKSCNLC